MPASIELTANKAAYWFENRDFDREFRQLNDVRSEPTFDFLPPE
ncbi:MAG: hypothetical protein WD845_08060 [Pirellulales bacterium]